MEAGKNATDKPGSSAPGGRPVNPDTTGNPILRFIKQFSFGQDFISGGECFSVRFISYHVIFQSNRIPLTFVVMLFLMTLLIVVDRGLYLRKWIPGKFAYQLLMIVFLHVWVFFVLPSLTRRAAVENSVARMFYIVKCLYLLVSAWQIRNGYPQLCIGNLLTHAYGLFNMICFKIFMAVPFLFELRTAIDWTWTDTSMPLFDFFNMENFFAAIYNLKCART
ncbi:unnamed protein product, partial [Strongylus vulgaris]